MHRATLVRLATMAAVAASAGVALGGIRTAGSRRVTSAAPPCSPQVDIVAVVAKDPDFRHVQRDIDSIFAASVARATMAASSDRYEQITLLGKILLFDKDLSVNRNIACVTCHSEETGYTGAVEIINRTIVAYPASVGGVTSARKPQSYGYAAFAPILHYDAAQKNFYGGNFWDMRATGTRIANAAAEQAQGPPVNPLEMALPDAACAVFRMSRGSYRAYFERVWGAQAFAIHWPANVERVCSAPGPAVAHDPLPVHLSAIDRGIASSTYDDMALSMASFEASPEISRFTSKFDSALAHPDQQVLTSDEQAGWTLFRGKGKCNTCHLDGGDNRGGGKRTAPAEVTSPSDAADVAPLFTDFTSSNLGVPKNRDMRFFCENTPTSAGYTPNPAGMNYVDRGVGDFLRSKENPNSSWAALAPQFDGAMRVPTVRSVDKRPRPDFTKAYMHNGYLKTLKEVVHFYNTRDVLSRCQGDNPAGEKVSCWPAPEVAANVDSTVGRLGLTDREEDQIVAFLKTLTDGPPSTGTPPVRRR